jgi:DNA-binding NarL/FixJ family response regulator
LYGTNWDLQLFPSKVPAQVKNHVSNTLGRLGLRDRTQATIYTHKHNLLG